VLEITPNLLGMTMGKVSFGGVAKEVCLAYTPEIEVGDYVIVHAGFALNRLDEQEAQEVFELLRQMGECDELLQLQEADLAAATTAGPENA
jgi:hydrogenase expression/formation protein HypC